MKRTEIVVELDEEYVIRSRLRMSLAWCSACGAQVQMLTPDQAAMIAGISPRLIYRWIEAGRVHFIESGDSQLFICESSLPNPIAKVDDVIDMSG